MSPDLTVKIGKYEVLEKLGEGGMGVVYKARDPMMDRIVAIKKMTGNFADNPEHRERFLREARSLAKLQHPNIVAVYELDVEGGAPYMVMEFLEGQSLDKLITARTPVNMVQKLDYMIQTCHALNYAHQLNIVHRDVKPANVLLLKDGIKCKLVDFGIARAAGSSGQTATGMALGTTPYMSPQQIKAVKNLDGRSDIFSAGVMLYQMLTGVLPWEADEPLATAIKILQEPFPPLSSYLLEYPPALDMILDRALAKEADERYSTAEEFAADLQQVQAPLKSAMIQEYVAEARTAYASSDHNRARELVSQVLKLDPQQSDAKHLNQELLQIAQRQQRSGQIVALRDSAEKAIGQNRYEDALKYLDEGLRLDKTNQDLKALREQVMQGIARQEEVRKKVRLAEHAQKLDDLATAKEMVEKALELDPTDTQARMMRSSIERRVAEQQKFKQVKELSEAARRELTARHFTEANDLIRKLEEIAPELPDLEPLKRAASSGQEQEQRRRKLQQIVSGVQQALSAGEITRAGAALDDAAREFPNDPQVVQLRQQVESARQKIEREKFIEDQVTSANRLLNQQQPTEALRIAEQLAQRYPSEGKVQSLLSTARDTATKQRADRKKQELLESARTALREQRYNTAIEMLESARIEFPSASDVVDTLRVAREEAARQAGANIEAMASTAKVMMERLEFQSAIELLKEAIRQQPSDVLAKLLNEAETRGTEHTRNVRNILDQVGQLADQGELNDAIGVLDAQDPLLGKSTLLAQARERLVSEREHYKALRAPLEKARECAERGEFEAARSILDQCRSAHGDSVMLGNAASDLVQAEQLWAVNAVTQAVDEAADFINRGQFGQAGVALNLGSEWVAQVDDELRARFREVQQELARKQSAAEPISPLTPPTPQIKAAQAAAGAADDGATRIFEYGAKAPPAPAAAAAAPAPAQTPPAVPATDIFTAERLQQVINPDASVMIPPPPKEEPPAKEPKGKKEAKKEKKAAKAEAAAAPVAEPPRPPKPAVAPPPPPPVVERPKPAARAEHPPAHISHPPVAAEEPSSKKWIGIGAAVAVVVLGAVGYFVMKPGEKAKPAENVPTTTSTETPATPPPTTTTTAAAPAPVLGSLSVETSVDGADVFVDNQLKGSTAGGKTKLDLVPGSHTVRVEKAGYDKAEKQVEVAKDSEARVQFTLNKSATAAVEVPKDPYLIVKALPGASIKVDQSTVGTAAGDGTLAYQTKPGRHKVEVTLNGYEPFSTTVNPKAGDRLPVEATLKAIPAPVANFSASASSIQQGQATELKWETENATEVTIEGIGQVPAKGQRQVSPTSNTNYTLVAKGEGGTSTRSVAISVAAAPKAPTIGRFSAGPEKIEAGQSARLQWATTNASEASINEGVGSVQPNDSREVSPAKTTTYVLTAKGPGGTVTSQPVTITVEAAPKPVAAPPTPAPTPAGPNDSELIKELIEHRLKKAFEDQSVAEMSKIWTSTPKDVTDLLKSGIQLSMSYSCTPAVTGETAQARCSQTVAPKGGSPQTVSVVFSLKKVSGNWQLQGSRVGK